MPPNIKSDLPFFEPVKIEMTATSLQSLSPQHTRNEDSIGNQADQADQNRQNGTTPLPYQEEKTANTRLGRLYNKILTYGPWMRYAVYIIPIAIILMIPILVGAAIPVKLKNKPKIGGVRLQWFFTYFEAIWLSFWVTRGFAALIPIVFNYFASARSLDSGTKKYTRVLENLFNPLTAFLWVVVSFVLFGTLFSTAAEGNYPKGWTSSFKKILGGILVASILFLIQKMIVQLICVNWHERSFHNKIKKNKRNVHLLGVLFTAAQKLFPLYGKEFYDEDCKIYGSSLTASVVQDPEGQPRKGSTPRLRRVSTGLARLKMKEKDNSFFGNIATQIKGQDTSNKRSPELMVSEALDTESASKALALRLWGSFVFEDCEVLRLSDVEEALSDTDPDQAIAEECFHMLDPNENGDINLDEMISRMEEVNLERKSLSQNMYDASHTIKSLDKVLGGVATILSLFTLATFADAGFKTILATASTILIAMSFIASGSAQEFIASCIFVFVKHPYDTGDRLDIVFSSGKVQSLYVDQIALMYTRFRNAATQKHVQISNSVLKDLPLNNISRSSDLVERIEFYTGFDTSLEDVDALRVEMQKFVDSNKREWKKDMVLHCIDVCEGEKFQLALKVKHQPNFTDERIRRNRLSKITCALVSALRRMYPAGGAPLGNASNPKYHVTVSDEIAITARDDATTGAEEAGAQYLDSEKSRVTKKRVKNDGTAPLARSITADSSATAVDEQKRKGRRRASTSTTLAPQATSSGDVPALATQGTSSPGEVPQYREVSWSNGDDQV